MKSLTVAALATLLACACGERKPEQAAGMSGMMMKSDSLMPIMRAHLDSLGAIPGASLPGMVAAHEAVASQMLDAMGSDMRMMDMQPDSAWTALADSVKRDLAELPSLSGRALETRMGAHLARMRRLMDVHAGMMRR